MLDLRDAENSPDRLRVTNNYEEEGSAPLQIEDPTHYLHPYLDSASWLYLDTNPMMRIANPGLHHPQIIEYSMPAPKRKIQHHCSQDHDTLRSCQRNRHHRHHHHHHHHHHRHCDHCHNRYDCQDHQNHHRRYHRRVASDPGDFGNRNSQLNVAQRHRRVISLDGSLDHASARRLVQTTIAEASEDEPSSPDEAAKTLTFRKVPWHPNLHMLKIRQT